MKKLILVLMIVLATSVLAKKKKMVYEVYASKVINLTTVTMMRYSPNIKGNAYYTKAEIISYLRVCTYIKYKKIIKNGYKKGQDISTTTVQIFKTGFEKCIKED